MMTDRTYFSREGIDITCLQEILHIIRGEQYAYDINFMVHIIEIGYIYSYKIYLIKYWTLC